MKRSVGWFLFYFVIFVATAATLILLIPAAIGPDSTVPTWLLSVLGALFAASAFVAWKVRPNWKEISSTHP